MAREIIAVVVADAALGEMLQELFADAGYDVSPCTDTDEAVALVRAVQPAVVVMEAWLHSPTDAWQLFDRLTTDPSTAAIPIVVLTDDSILATAESDFARRAAACIEKPFDLNDLLTSVQKVITHS